MLNHSSTRKANKDLRERIEKLCVSVKPVLQDADIDDTQLLTLTREDLNELFPGHRNFQLRKRIMELLTEEVQEPVGPGKSTLVNTLRNFIQRNDRGEPAAESIWKEYLCALRNVEKQLTAALDFLKSHIELMENLSEVPMQEAASSSEFTLYERYAERGNQNLHATSHCIHFSLPVKIHSVVCGNTLGAHDMILRHLQSVEHTSAEDCRVILVFCPIASRPGTDIEAAIRKVPGTLQILTLTE
ncbi:hypothetical protein P4O66_008828 [Electrophorus voltai]|uniref:Uncharacterized protein n=1 Tax=Electrophorus voltai TaxID=2609070 RepID=A0AAD8ZD40_9TELE|nr:hypothetical protein P4O66_008828 [Electrophorus voltai]